MRRRDWLGAGLALLLAGPAHAASDCATLEACVAELRAMAPLQGPHHQYTLEERELTVRLVGFEGAVLALVGLLADPDIRVAEMAAKALTEVDYIYHGFLPEIRAALDRGVPWLGSATGKMSDDAAAREAVVRLLAANDADSTEAYGVKLAGARAIPHLVAAAACPRPCGDRDHYVMGEVLADMGDAGALAAPGLLALAADPASSPQVAFGSLEMLSYLGPRAAILESKLLALRARRADLREPIDETLVRIGAKRAGAILGAMIARRPDVHDLRRLAELGRAGRAAGPQVMPLLDAQDWDVRVAAIRALGAIGHAPARRRLVALLDDDQDVRRAWAAAEALAHLRNRQADAALRRAATSHWYPPVRARAAASLAPPPPPRPARDPHELDFSDFDWPDMEVPVCAASTEMRVAEPAGTKLDAGLLPADEARLQALAYTTTVLSYGPAEEPPPPAPGEPAQVVMLTTDQLVEHRTPREQVPRVALRIDDGWLAGGNRGEWGGEVVFLGDDGVHQTFLDANVEDLYRLGERLVAIAGLVHLSFDQGSVHALSRDATGRWHATPWRGLPGAPRQSWPTADGGLVIDTGRHGLLHLAADGAMRMAACAEPAKLGLPGRRSDVSRDVALLVR